MRAAAGRARSVRTAAWVLVAAVVGLGLGAAAAFTVQDSAGEPEPASTTAPTTTLAVAKPLPRAPVRETDTGLYLAWTQGGLSPTLPPGLGEGGLVQGLTIVRRDPVDLVRTSDAQGATVDEPAAGFVIPIDAMAFDPATYQGVVPTAQKVDFAGLADDELLLGATSARLRRLGPGGSLTFSNGATFTVAGVVDDEVIGGAEVATTHRGGEAIGVAADRYVLFTSNAERAALEALVRDLAPADEAVRLRAVGETPFLRNGDAVLPQSVIKERFGEFTYRPNDGAGDDIVPDPAWVAENIVTEPVPLLGQVRCHRAIIPALRGALAQIEREQLGHLVPADGYLGCFVPRTTRYDEQLSRHSWGVALDLNYPKNPTGQRSVQDERMVEILQEWGFTWGGEWLVPDPAHFEYVRPPDEG